MLIGIQGWKGSTKARTFVLALRDFLLRKRSPGSSLSGTATPSSTPEPMPASGRGSALALKPKSPKEMTASDYSPDDVSWALPYISMHYFRAILDAFDNDASGLITIEEANAFTESLARPGEWQYVYQFLFYFIFC